MVNPQSRSSVASPIERKLDAVKLDLPVPEMTSQSRLLHLPLEICTEILALLDSRDILACSETCKLLRTLVSSSTTLQYILALSAHGMRDGLSALSLTSSERLNLLHTRRASWRTLTLGTPSTSIHLPGLCQAYDLVGGYYGKCSGESAATETNDRHTITLVTLPSLEPPQEAKVETYDLGVQTKDFASDPSQDLIALLEMPGVDGSIKLHLRRLSEPGTTHPEASVGVLMGSSESCVAECMLDMADDVLVLYVRELEPRVIIFNWRTGEQLVNMEPPSHPVMPDDFSFISPRSFLLTYAHTDAIRLFSFTSPSSSQTLEATATLRIPPPAPGARFAVLNAITGPWLARAPSSSAHFPLNERRIHMFNLTIVGADELWHELLIVVRAQTLLSILQHAMSPPDHSMASQLFSTSSQAFGLADEGKILREWTEWLPSSARVIALSQQFHWQRYVHGSRMLARGIAGLHMLDFDVPIKDGERKKWKDTGLFGKGSIAVWEEGEQGVPVSGVLNVRGDTDADVDGGGGDGTQWAQGLVIDEVDAPSHSLNSNPPISPFDKVLEQEPELVSALPYGCVCVPVPVPPDDGRGGTYTGFMLDEQRVVGVRSVEDGEVLDVWTL